jgi:hypothetical protein
MILAEKITDKHVYRKTVRRPECKSYKPWDQEGSGRKMKKMASKREKNGKR